MFKNLDINLHTHSELEKLYNIPKNYVIIDDDVYIKILNLLQEYDNLLEEKSLTQKVESSCIFPKSLIHIYPNKFKIISDTDQAKDPGLYYIVNDRVPKDCIPLLEKWVSDIFEYRPFVPAGLKDASISELDFCKKYNYSLGKLNYKMDIPMGKRDYFSGLEINPLRIHDKLGDPSVIHITLWGTYLKDIRVKGASISIQTAAVLMSIFDILLKQGKQRLFDYLRLLEVNRWVYKASSDGNEFFIQPNQVAFYFCYNFSDLSSIERDFEYLKKYLIK